MTTMKDAAEGLERLELPEEITDGAGKIVKSRHAAGSSAEILEQLGVTEEEAADLTFGPRRDAAYWKERCARAEGYVDGAELDAAEAVRGREKPLTAAEIDALPYAIMDCRTIVGNTPLFWGPNNGGYMSIITDIGRYTRKEAYTKRDTDFAVPMHIVVACARPRVDIQLLNRELEIRGIPRPAMGHGGNDYAMPMPGVGKGRRRR